MQRLFDTAALRSENAPHTMWRTLLYGAGVLVLAASAVLARARLPRFDDLRTNDAAAIPRRIASLSPSTTEFCAALGLTDRLVARSTFCEWPPEVLRVPAVGALNDPDLERLMGLRPDLVLIPGKSRFLHEMLLGVGFRVESMPDSSLEDVYVSLATLGAMTGRETAAQEKIASIRRDLALIARPAKPQLGKRVLLVVTPSHIPPGNPWVALPGSYLDGLLQLAGHVNALPAMGRDWSEVSLEAVLKADPDVILEFWPEVKPADHDMVRQAWSTVGPMKAVRNGQVHLIVGRNHLLPGPRVAETLKALEAVLGT